MRSKNIEKLQLVLTIQEPIGSSVFSLFNRHIRKKLAVARQIGADVILGIQYIYCASEYIKPQRRLLIL